MAANRGIVSSGPYRLVRHPIYLGYLLSHVGFVLSAFSWQNLATYIGLYVLQVGRILEEEKTLSHDGAYQDYKLAVRHRLVPGLF